MTYLKSRRLARFLAAASVPFILPVSAVQAQTHTEPEPLLDAARAAFSQEALTLGMLLQTVVDPSVDGSDPDPASVQVAAMRLLLSGALDGGFDYLIQTNFAAGPSILDARVGWSASERFGIWAGRFKAPLSRELLTFAGAIDFVNRSRVVDALALGRQLGVQAGGRISPELRWSLGGFTGPTGSPANEPLAGVARVEVTPDVGREDTELSIAASAAVGRDEAIAGASIDPSFEGDGSVLALDARLTSGRLLVAGEGVLGDYDPLGSASVDASGLFLTLGWMTSQRTQALLRWDRFRSVGVDSDDVMVVGFNAWPTSASEIQINWLAPLAGSSAPHKILINFQLGF